MAVELKVFVVGTTQLPKQLAASARERGGRFWIALPDVIDDEDSDELVDRTAKKLGGDARVIEVEMSTGLRGEDLTASTYIAPGRQDEMDLTEIAAEIFADWTDEAGSPEEEAAARELAWALVDVLAKAIEEVR